VDTAVVTGAGRGLGRALAERLARHGLAVLVTDVDADGRRLSRTIPAYRALIMRSLQLFPRAGFRILPAFRWFGERRQHRWREP
jgi:NAD(P)-dependent dehydrogenase (short-subunit alcohol dehydrogenase family)